MNYLESVNYLYGLGHEVLAAKYGLENIIALLEKLGRPDLSFKSVLVAGTNGKGSVSAMLDAIAREAGHRVGLYTSPHLIDIEERITVGGAPISSLDFASVATRVREASELLVEEGRVSAVPTFFEQLTAIALCHFSDKRVELAILEVGLGGRLDATNAVERILSVITNIDYDHQNLLGDTIPEIASEKAAIVKSGGRVVIGRQTHPIATEVLMKRCLTESVLPVFANEPTNVVISDSGRTSFNYESARGNYSNVILGLRGRHQAENAAAVIEAAELLTESGIEIGRRAILDGLRRVVWPGRLEYIAERPSILIDGAHNPAGARTLRRYIDEFWRGAVTLVFGAMADKDVEGMAAALFPRAKSIVLTRVRDSRAATNARMGRIALNATQNVIFTETVSQALSWARSVTPPDGLIVFAGSLYLAGEVKRLLVSEYRIPV